MPISTIQRLVCDLCGKEKERELPIELPVVEDWISVDVKDGRDNRKKRRCAVCPQCLFAVRSVAQVTSEEVPPISTP